MSCLYRFGVWRVRLVRLVPPLLSFFAVCVCNRVDFAVVLFAPSRGLSVCVVAIRRGVLHSTGLTGARPGCVAGLCGGWVGSSAEKALIVRPSEVACSLEHWARLAGLLGPGSGRAAVRSARLATARVVAVREVGLGRTSP